MHPFKKAGKCDPMGVSTWKAEKDLAANRATSAVPTKTADWYDGKFEKIDGKPNLKD